jgi:hypothetical protein
VVNDLKILMVCTEYPPMQGGVGRYTHNLVKCLVSNNIDVIVVSSSDGSGDYRGISPYNKNNSELLLKTVRDRSRYSACSTRVWTVWLLSKFYKTF